MLGSLWMLFVEHRTGCWCRYGIAAVAVADDLWVVLSVIVFRRRGRGGAGESGLGEASAPGEINDSELRGRRAVLIEGSTGMGIVRRRID